ncbi:ABC transporter ATP-binding protein [Sinorhizobium medicae]|uniref:sn-glycerol-3-phosphate import ATP-binding protein UgpC n=1 Tax=Sinorhizobium medicae TaxID=110321 RepID=A0A508WTT2_9HYPH|nr:sn-glycerol-3-phosphate ABC transporter ATP-binding protein UgpC [Sinorhizobium medicae]MBO1944137.1 sn-glycerol-3-phosphate ABC transporter ATP-binding protein UgpC [Sinorhizobium medicae]MDX0425195.1 sn-glycerol-3-phosphate ABC transporter ATP-binding protein UgpC [Sinorhizobium medicae]MDX0430435.1 sn-glycerol-3-phosphate ABC transporter ATP-binding protein UgpC [Sinorhizobium medicae]MDX0443638.1 sn-glycerol-3-phosphate ABC transporter ATP-binding protein UgpC [Sinorhizobium medicae]MDX
MSEIVLRGLRKSFGSVEVIKEFDLTIADGERLVFVGPSGCGKSTLLRMICGIDDISFGRIYIDGVDVTALPAARRGLAMVFQNYALYPHMTVRQNIGFSLRVAGVERTVASERVVEVAQSLHLDHLLERYPRELSGGQRQRVAIGRAIVRQPKAFLFDEPLSNLDAALRAEMRLEVARLHSTYGATMIYVTHDQTEAMTLADRIVVLNQGHIEQIGTPSELYEQPANRFVAEFIGSPRINIVAGRMGPEGMLLMSGADRQLPVAATRDVLAVGIRPEHIRPVETGGHLNCTVRNVEFFGAESFVYADCNMGADIVFRTDGRAPLRPGENCQLLLTLEQMLAFDDGGKTVPLQAVV